MFTLIMNIESKEGKVDEIMKVMKENVSEVLKRFPACKVYEVYLDQEAEVGSGEDLYSDLSFPKPRKNIITIIEKWDSVDDYDNYETFLYQQFLFHQIYCHIFFFDQLLKCQ